MKYFTDNSAISRLITVAALAVMCASAVSCAGIRPPGLQPITAPVPDASLDELRARIAMSGISGLRSEVRTILLDADGERVGSFGGALLIRPGAETRLVLYDVIGARVVDVSARHGRMSAYLPSQDTVYEGEMPLPWISSGGDIMHTRDKDGRHVLFEIEPGTDALASRMYVFNERLENVKAASFVSGVQAAVAYLYDYAAGVPMGIDLQLPGLYTFRMRLVEPELGVELPDAAFDNLPLDSSALKFAPMPRPVR